MIENRDADIEAIVYPSPRGPSPYHDPKSGPHAKAAALAKLAREARDERDALQAEVTALRRPRLLGNERDVTEFTGMVLDEPVPTRVAQGEGA